MKIYNGYTEVSGELHAPTTLSCVKSTLYQLERMVGELQSWSTFSGEENNISGPIYILTQAICTEF
jgi:hypothetical protein